MLSPDPPSAFNWRTLGASVTGTSHHKTGRGCDDAHAIRQLQDGTLLLAVADGAGSASRSAEGATYAVSAALDIAEDMLTQPPENQEQWQMLLRIVLESVRATLQQLASGEISLNVTESEPMQQLEQQLDQQLATQQLSIPPLREFATTLLVTIVTPRWIAATQIGDGAVVVQHQDGTLQALTWPDHGEYINEASFITDADYSEHAQYSILAQQELLGVALFTDGIERLVLNFATKTPGNPFFTSMFTFAARTDANEAELAAFLASERVCERTDDDKTLVLAVHL